MMFGKEHGTRKIVQLLPDQLLRENLFFDPHRHGGHERAPASWCHAEVVLEDSLEFQQRLVIKSDVVDLARAKSRFLEAVFHRVPRKLRVVPLACESFLLSRGDNLAV